MPEFPKVGFGDSLSDVVTPGRDCWGPSPVPTIPL